MSYKIVDIEGIGVTYGAKLAEHGIKTTAALLEAAASRKGRKQLAETTGLSEKLILGWANKADLMRIKGIGTQYSDLLEAAGVDTVKELKNRKAANLTEKMAEVNAVKKLARRSPPLSLVEDWVEQAGRIEAVMTY